MDTSFNITILYSTIAVMQPNELFNDWNDMHVSQGFAWRKNSVSFGTLSEDSECEVRVYTCETFQPNESAIRIIALPFEIKTGGIEIASITDSQLIDISEGEYELIFSAIPTSEETFRYEFAFIKSLTPQARILRADSELSPPEELLMEAEPAE